MTDTASPTLLPEGLRDVLPPDAAFESGLVERLSGSFQANGYERVAPPLVEFESTLLAGVGAATADRIFRLVDPVSQRTLGVRADVTSQIARIASTRLKNAPRPLRLMYAGQVMRVKGRQLRPERQFTQVGFELVGPDSVAADAEAIIVATEGVTSLGINSITVDLALPPLVQAILSTRDFDKDRLAALLAALDHKDAAEIKTISGSLAEPLTALVEATGPLALAKDRLSGVGLPADAAKHLERMFAVSEHIANEAHSLSLTVDLVENRGLQYHSGLTFFLFAKGTSREIGRGGRYQINQGNGKKEPATGATLFIDGLTTVVPDQEYVRRVLVPVGTSRSEINKLQADGLRVISALDDSYDLIQEAQRLRCSHVYEDGALQEVSDSGNTV